MTIPEPNSVVKTNTAILIIPQSDAGRRLRSSGFTLVELLVVIAIMAIVASLLLPALGRARSKAEAAACMSNFHQMMLAWQMYADDNRGALVPNNSINFGTADRSIWPTWAGGSIEYGQRDGTNSLWLTGGDPLRPVDGVLGRYLQNPKVFRCPSDRSKTEIGGRKFDRVRSSAMNVFLGTRLATLFLVSNPSAYSDATTIDQIPRLGRDTVFVWADIHEDNIADCTIYVGESNPRSTQGFSPAPAGRHSGGSSLSFVDSHVEIHRWKNPNILAPARGVLMGPVFETESSEDYRWLRSRTVRATTDSF